jgi:TolA-binding protein
VAEAAKRVLAEVQQRCTEAMKAIEQHDYLVVLGALEDQIRYVSVRLMVLREINEIQNQNYTKRRNI